jgi:hypothetical protein
MTQHHELTRHIPRRGGRIRRVLLFTVVLIAVLAAGTTPRGVVVVANVQAFLEFYVGVFALVGLTGIVVFGLLASARFTPIWMRILAQGGHRALAVMSMAFLAAHIALKVMEGHAAPLAAVVPVAPPLVSLGTIAGDLMFLVFLTGIARGRFIGAGRTWTWRVIHISAYLSWPIAIYHGLNAGRPAKFWVTDSYVICMALVAIVAAWRFGDFLKRRGEVGPRPVARPAADRSPLDEARTDIPDETFWSDLKAEVRR